MFEEIDSTIQSVERLHRAVSGRDSGGAEGAPIPPERDAAKHVDEQLDKLLAMLTLLPGAGAATARAEAQGWAPPVSTFAGRSELLVWVDLPGVSRDCVNVTARPGSVVVTGLRAPPPGELRIARAEAALGSFRREIALPLDAALPDISASLKDGVLELRVPRAARAASQAIPVQ